MIHRRVFVMGRLALPVTLALVAIGCGGGTSSSAPASTAPSSAPASTASPAATSAPSTAASASSAAAGNVTGEVSQFKIELSPSSVAAGSVTFDVTNKGTVEHEFVVFKTDLAADKLPLSKDGTEVDEEGTGVTAVDEIGEFKPGITKSLTVDLPAGHYVVICNVPTHYTKGMRAEFTTN
jgi:uncharacterized cupredoxin-like copper-binding protein